MTRYRFSRGKSRPLGATVRDEGVNFSLYSESASSVELLLFDRYDADAPFQVIRLTSRHHRNFNYWHVFVHGVGAGLIYGYRVFGPSDTAKGHRFDPQKVLVDPYARAIVYGDNWSRSQAISDGDNTKSAMKGLVVASDAFDWEGVEPPVVDPSMRVIYELHVRGYTRHASSGVEHPGTFLGLIEKIPYLKTLGVTTVELLPVFQFDDLSAAFVNPDTGEGLCDFWGYNPLGFFAPHRSYYQEDWSGMRRLTEFREMVRAFHRAGIEVFLDVVFNHSGEGDERGPTVSFRGIENRAYYQLKQNDLARYADFSGCGNSLNCNHPIVRRLILDSLRYWTDVMHVDGFRFDLASILSRGEKGTPLEAPPLTWEIECDPTLERTTLIAEAWDAAGLYQVGAFPGERWEEWNGQFRDDVRQFWRGELGFSGRMATRLMGSPDLYESHGRLPTQCINFVTCHDGFTLYDLVSYREKHNRANGEDGRDGCNMNFSQNFGVEGPSDDPEVQALRQKQMRNMLTVLFLSQGTPMLLGGDEFSRSQQGNNNPWCQDNELSWVDWNDLERNRSLFQFVQGLIEFRKAHPGIRRERFLLGIDASAGLDPEGYTRVCWHGVEPNSPDWGEASQTLAYMLTESKDDVAIYVILNGGSKAVTFRLPVVPGEHDYWLKAIDTGQNSPLGCSKDDIDFKVQGELVVGPCSMVVLLQPPGQKDIRIVW